MPDDRETPGRVVNEGSAPDSEVLLRIAGGLGPPRRFVTDNCVPDPPSDPLLSAAGHTPDRATGVVEPTLPADIDGFHIGARVPWPFVGPPEVWSRERIRAACARRDVAEVFRVLNHAGVSQRRLAAAVGIGQSEVSEILHGRRVMSVELLERIADGLGCPRSWWGLAHDSTALGYAGDLARVTLAISVDNARQLALTVAALSTQVGTLLETLGVQMGVES